MYICIYCIYTYTQYYTICGYIHDRTQNRHGHYLNSLCRSQKPMMPMELWKMGLEPTVFGSVHFLCSSTISIGHPQKHGLNLDSICLIFPNHGWFIGGFCTFGCTEARRWMDRIALCCLPPEAHGDEDMNVNMDHDDKDDDDDDVTVSWQINPFIGSLGYD